MRFACWITKAKETHSEYVTTSRRNGSVARLITDTTLFLQQNTYTLYFCSIDFSFFKVFLVFSLSHFCFLKSQCILSGMIVFHYHGLLYPVYCQIWLCQFSLVDSIICYFTFLITDYFIQFIVRYDCVSFHLQIP